MGFSEIAKYVGYVGENKFDEGVVEFLCNLATAGFKKNVILSVDVSTRVHFNVLR